MDNYEILPLFSTPVFVGHISIDCKPILNTIVKLKYLKYNNSGKGSENEQVLELEELLVLKKQIDKKFEVYLYDILMYQKNSNFYFKHETSWVNLHQKNEYSPMHYHQNSMYSFIFYVDVDENSGDIIFSCGNKSTFSYNCFDVPVSSYNIFNSGQWKINPRNNMIIMFPSHLSHCVTESKSKKDRYSIAGNYFCRGSIINRTKKLEL